LIEEEKDAKIVFWN